MKDRRVLLSGNEAIAEGALAAGCGFYAGYPITPQNELIGYMAQHMRRRGGVFLQAESEIAAINMVFGAAASGVRAMTSSSSPGISLKQEGISYLAGAQLPAVIVNIMRGGPGLGNIEPAQGDYFQLTRGGGHGDYRTIVLAPASVQEAYELMSLAFELADGYRNPVMVAGDGMLGQMMEPVVIQRSKAAGRKLKVSKPWALTGCKGRPANVIKSFFLQEGQLRVHNELLWKKYRQIERRQQRAETIRTNDASLIIVAYGMMARVAEDVVRTARLKGQKVGLLRPITLWPFPVSFFTPLLGVKRRPKILVLEMSQGQMYDDVRLAVGGRACVDFLGQSGGGMPSVRSIEQRIRKLLTG